MYVRWVVHATFAAQAADLQQWGGTKSSSRPERCESVPHGYGTSSLEAGGEGVVPNCDTRPLAP